MSQALHTSIGRRWVLATALVLGLAARFPGIFWGVNFPFGWSSHHVDEYTHVLNAASLISPQLPSPWPGNIAYPKGLAAHVAVPFVGARALSGDLMSDLPTMQAIVTAGRVVTTLYGFATIGLLFFIARRLFSDPRVAEVGALILALGGLHVSQSHFFVADVPALFWHLLGSYAIILGCDRLDSDDGRYVAGAAFCLGVAAGIKLMAAAVPSLLLLALLRAPRFYRAVLVVVSLIAGFVVVNLDSYSLYDILRTLKASGHEHIKDFSRIRGALIYMLQLPALFSAPVVLLSLLGLTRAIRRWPGVTKNERRIWLLAICMPTAVMGTITIFGPNNFPRHLIPFAPIVALSAAYGMVHVVDQLARLGLPKPLPVVALLLYLIAFVVDGERVFIQEPRNRAAEWLLQNVEAGTEVWWQGHGTIPRYRPVVFPTAGRPEVLVMEMHRANSYLSGMSWKNSMPTRLGDVHGVQTQDNLLALQAVFSGTAEYREVARFQEGYFMPEFTVTDALLGNRARNYVAEVVIFRKTSASAR